MSEIEDETNLKEVILQELSVKENTISGLHRAMVERGLKLHRLVLTGYLRALTELEILEERDVTPSKLYSIGKKVSSDLYATIGKVALSMDPDEAPEIALNILYYLFGRPVFLREIERCGVLPPRSYKKVMPAERLKYISKLGRSGIAISANSFMLEPEIPDPSILGDTYIKILNEVFDLKRFSKDTEHNPQTTLQ